MRCVYRPNWRPRLKPHSKTICALIVLRAMATITELFDAYHLPRQDFSEQNTIRHFLLVAILFFQQNIFYTSCPITFFSILPGSSPGTPPFVRKRRGCSVCTKDSGMIAPLVLTITLSLPMKKPASRPGNANIAHRDRRRIRLCASSTSIKEKGLGPTGCLGCQRAKIFGSAS